MSKPYLLPERKSTRDMEIEAARAGLEKVSAELKAIEKKICNRSYARTAILQDMKKLKADHRNLTSQMKTHRLTLEKWGLEK